MFWLSTLFNTLNAILYHKSLEVNS